MVPVAEFTNEKKEIILIGDFNVNILICDWDRDTADFVEIIYASSL